MQTAPEMKEEQLEQLRAELERTEVEEEKEPEQETEQEEVKKITLNDKEYTQEELDELIGLGTRAKEVSQSYGGFDKFVSEYGKKSSRIGDLKKRIEELEQSKTEASAPSDIKNEFESAREAARKLGIVLQDDLESYYENRRSGERLLESCKELEGEITGTDGRPKFDTMEVLQFMEKNPGFTNPEKAYEALHMDKVIGWKAEQILRQKSGGIQTIKSAPANKEPEKVQVGRDNLEALIREQFR